MPRQYPADKNRVQPTKRPPGEIVLVLDRIRSLYNVGSMIRTADGFGVSKVYLCGWTGTPDRSKVQKVALGAEIAVPWEKVSQSWRLIERLKKEGYTMAALETGAGSVDISRYKTKYPIALIVGNEVNGLSRAVIDRCNVKLEIPMHGVKKSFNVAVSCGIGLYHLRSVRA